MSGAVWGAINRLYVQKGIIKNRPLYVESENTFGIWFNGEDMWILGKMSYLRQGKLNYGMLKNTENAQCPRTSSKWEEHYDWSWNVNNDIAFNCEGNFYYGMRVNPTI